MKRERGSVKKLYPQIKEMHERGMTAQEIGNELALSRTQVHNVISSLGLSKRRSLIDESTLTYAINKPPVLEKIIIGEKRYTDILPVILPR